MATPRTTYTILTPFPYRGGWTSKGQTIDLLPAEAAQLLRAGRIGIQSTPAVAKPASKKATDDA